VNVKVIAGRVGDVVGPIVQEATDPTYLDVALEAGATFLHTVPLDHAAFLYVYEGSVRVGSGESAATVGAHQLAVLGNGVDIRLEGREPPSDAHVSRAIIVAGKPLREPVAKYGPFVMSTREEVLRAIDDFQNGKF
jgi:redox-sensitive bicupin YhaK (pirin superfamily)